jgi:voltage-gated potassium channel
VNGGTPITIKQKGEKTMTEQAELTIPQKEPRPVSEPKSTELKSTGYELFILLLSLVSIINLVIVWIDMIFYVSPLTREVLDIINAILTIFFIFDFSYRILTTSSKSHYFFRNWGWTDLLACVPALRIFRVFRIFKAVRLLRQFGPKNMLNEVVNNRAGSSLYLAIFGIIAVAEIASVVVLNVEAPTTDANITTAGDAVWWVMVTLTTVGYGDQFPITYVGRIAGVFVMFSGVALIGVLASFLSNFFLSPPQKDQTQYVATDPKSKLAELRALLEQQQAAQAELVDKMAELERML